MLQFFEAMKQNPAFMNMVSMNNAQKANQENYNNNLSSQPQ